MLLPICGKILKKIFFDQVDFFQNENELISINESGQMIPPYHQLISITLNIFESFVICETPVLFPDISDVVDKD